MALPDGPWSRLLQGARRWLAGPGLADPPPIPEALWRATLADLPWLAGLQAEEVATLRGLSARFLASKEFHGAQGLVINDRIALSIAVQACLPLIYLGADALDWYDDFVGIVIQPDEVLAPREAIDEAGVLHRWKEPLIGEAMPGGPVMLAWSHVAPDHEAIAQGHNLVIHEFAHQFDLRGKSSAEPANGGPILPAGFMGLRRPVALRLWRETWSAAYAHFRERLELAERFGEPAPWLDAYAAQAPAEFFAVACEAYWVARERFTQECPTLAPLLDAFFKRPPR